MNGVHAAPKARSDMIDRFLLFGGTGDLAGRFVFPALAALHWARKLPDGFQVVAAGRARLDDETFRREIATQLHRHASAIPPVNRYALLQAVHYRQVDLYDAESVGHLVEDAFAGEREAAVAIYLALPPSLFAPTLGALCRVSLPAGSRVAVEKPFGENLESARALNALLAKACGVAGESGAFRVDHFLGLAAVQNLFGMRLANQVLEPVWNSAHIEQIDIVWEETLGLEGRAAYYDQAGQLRDMIQNHLLQVLCLLTMEPPDSLRDSELRDAKVALLRSVRPPDPAQTRRARYTAGRSDGRDLPSYVDEPGVDPARAIETFAEVTSRSTTRDGRGRASSSAPERL